jgi:hypothetical protein
MPCNSSLEGIYFVITIILFIIFYFLFKRSRDLLIFISNLFHMIKEYLIVFLLWKLCNFFGEFLSILVILKDIYSVLSIDFSQ